MATLQPLFSNKSMRFIFVGGKGGVGTTSPLEHTHDIKTLEHTLCDPLCMRVSSRKDNKCLLSCDPARQTEGTGKGERRFLKRQTRYR